MPTTLQQIEGWANQGECETLEFKTTTSERKEAMHDLCAMINLRGGRVFFGIDPGGRILGQQVADRTFEELAEEVRLIEPPISPEIEKVEFSPGRFVIVVSHPSTGPVAPYSYKGIAYKRVSNTSVRMLRDEYNRILFERIHSVERWENQFAEGWSVADLDIAEITRSLEAAINSGRSEDPGTRNPEELLRGFGLMKEGKLLRAAPVLFGRPERLETEFTQCLLRLARFKGTDKTEFLDNRQIYGNAFYLLSQGEKFLRANLPIAGRITPNLFERQDDPLYPPVALREALANAVCHRDYSIGGGSVSIAIYDDRLEITSSGALHFGLTAESLVEPHDSLPWNPLLVQVFYRRGIIERWGRGTLKIVELMQAANLPRPEFEEIAGCLVVRFRPSRYVPPQRVAQDITPRQQQILQLLSNEPWGVPLRDFKVSLQPPVPEWEIKNDLTALRALGLIESIGYGRGAAWYLVVK